MLLVFTCKIVFPKPLWQYCLPLLVCLLNKKTAHVSNSQLDDLVPHPQSLELARLGHRNYGLRLSFVYHLAISCEWKTKRPGKKGFKDGKKR